MEKEKRMNILIWLQIICLVGILVIIGVELKRPQQTAPLAINGDSPQTSVTAIWSEDAAKRIIKSYSTFSVNSNSVKLQAERISTLAIVGNSTSPIKELEELLTDCGSVNCSNSPTLGAIEMFYAIVGGNFKLFYKPVVFCRESGARYGQGGHFYAPYVRQMTGPNYYQYDANATSFVTVTLVDAQNGIAAYKTNIRLKRPTLNSPAPNSNFYTDPNHDIYSDVTSVIIPLDEFTTLVQGTRQVCLWSAVEPLSLCETDSQGNKADKELVKHVIVLSSDDVSENYSNRVLNYSTASSFSDMSHLCPPSCNASQFLFALREVPN